MKSFDGKNMSFVPGFESTPRCPTKTLTMRQKNRLSLKVYRKNVQTLKKGSRSSLKGRSINNEQVIFYVIFLSFNTHRPVVLVGTSRWSGLPF